MKTQFILSAIIFFALSATYAQQPYDNGDKIFKIVEERPQYPGGEKALMEYLRQCPYPASAKENQVEGTVYIRFIIEKDGRLSNFEMTKGADKILNAAAIDCIKSMPDWKPGRQNGSPARVQYIVPIKFDLAEDKKKQKKKG